MKPRTTTTETTAQPWRLTAVALALSLAALTLIARAIFLQVVDQNFLEKQGDARFTRVAKLSANRGMILDRNGDALAVSTPVDTVWANPRELPHDAQVLTRLAKALDRDPQWLTRRVTSNLDREFVYLVRHMAPKSAARIKAMNIPGVYLLREYRRYYPAGEVTGHLLGFTSVDDVGQEGLELAFDQWLGGTPGAKRVIQDRLGRTIEDIERISAPRPGQDLRSSIDLRVQYLAYRELKAAVQANAARAGSVVVLDIATGEVLAMVNQPSFNPNDREQYVPSRYRNRAATDIFEPGSSIKPFVVAGALESGRFHPETLIDTGPGFVRVGIKTIQDKHNLGTIDVTTVLTKSSNVGVVKIALSFKPEQVWRGLDRFGFGHVTGSGYPGESAGLVPGLPALAADHAGHDVVRLRAVGHAVAARGSVRGDRLGRHPSTDQHAARRLTAAGRARARRGHRQGSRAHDGQRRQRRRHGASCGRRRLPRLGQDRHGVEGGRRQLLDAQVHGRVWRRGAGDEPAARRARRDRRAEPRPVLRRRRRRAGVFGRDVRRAAHARDRAR
jgi:cell division protein FtsI/penicillin-binding protein 2